MVLASLLGCSDSASNQDKAEAPRDGSHALLVAEASGRIQVAEVNGVPIHDDCVVMQAQALGVDRQEALAQCIDFELLAQAAQARGKAGDADVRWAMKTEAVRRLLDTEIRAPLPAPDKVDRKLMEAAYKKIEPRIHIPEIRYLAHVLAPFPEDEPPGTPADVAARALAQDIHAALAGRRDLTTDEFIRVAKEVAGDRALGPMDEKTKTFKREEFKIVPKHPGIHEAFSDATFAIAEVGTVSQPTRTHVGWHLILLTRIEPEKNANVDQAAELVLSYLQTERYQALVARLRPGVQVDVDEDALIRLQAAEDALRFTPSESP